MFLFVMFRNVIIVFVFEDFVIRVVRLLFVCLFFLDRMLMLIIGGLFIIFSIERVKFIFDDRGCFL